MGTIDDFFAAMKALKDAPAPDWRSAPLQEVDRIKAGAMAACAERFGRAPSFHPLDQEGESAVLFTMMEEADSDFIRTASTPGFPPAGVEQAREAFGSALLAWVNCVTRDWPGASVYKKQQALHAATWER